MTLDEIKANAPSDATHYMENKYTGIIYLKMEENFLFDYFNCKMFVKRKGWCGELTIKKYWFFGTRYKVFFNSDCWAQTSAYKL